MHGCVCSLCRRTPYRKPSSAIALPACIPARVGEGLRGFLLKIDKSFTDAIAHEAVTSNVIAHIIEMARTLRLQIVAEGIESAHQVEWLRAQGVEGGQGYHFSRPLSAEAFLDWCRQH